MLNCRVFHKKLETSPLITIYHVFNSDVGTLPGTGMSCQRKTYSEKRHND